MTVSELRTLVDNLDEYIHVPGGIDRLKKMVLHLAVSGQLVPQDPSEGTGEELYRQIQAEKADLVKQGTLKKQKPLAKIESDDLLPGIPVNWVQVKVGDASIYQQRGKSPKYTATSSYPVISQKCVRWLHIDWQYVKFITSESIEKYEEFRPLRDGDLLLNSTGTGTMGRVGIYRKNEQYDRVVADSHVTVVRFGDFVSAEFAHIFFRSPYVQEDVESKASGSTNQIEWNLLSIQNEIMPLPPLGEQKRIVAKVDSIFSLIVRLAEDYKSEQAERCKLVASSLAQLAKGDGSAQDNLALTHLSEIIRTKADAKILRQTILHLAVSGQLVPQAPSEGTGEELYQQIQAGLVGRGKAKKQKTLSEINEDEIPFEIPKSWTWIRLGGVIKVSSGNSLVKSQMTENGKYAVYGGNGVSGYYDDYMFEEQRVVVGRVGAQCGNVHITERNSWVTDNAFVVNFPEKYIYREFITVLLRFLDLKKTHKGSAQPVISGSSIYPIPVQLPPFAEQKRIVAKATQLFELVAELERYQEK